MIQTHPETLIARLDPELRKQGHGFPSEKEILPLHVVTATNYFDTLAFNVS